MRLETRAAAALLAVGLAGLLASGTARAQEKNAQPPALDMEPIGQPITLYVADTPIVTVALQGTNGPLRLTGALVEAPQEPLRLTDAAGRPRDARWSDVVSLTRTEYPQEGLPTGSFQVSLVTDVTVQGRYGDPLTTGSDLGSRTRYEGWRLLRLPEGSLTLRGEPYGTLTFPISRLTSFSMEPIYGNVTELPEGEMRLQVLDDKVIGIPPRLVHWFRRDLAAGTATVVLLDQQVFTGRLVEMPRVSINVTVGEKIRSIPLERVVALQRTLPGANLGTMTQRGF